MNNNVDNKAGYWLFWLILAAMAAVFPPFAWHDNTSGFLTDDGMYLLLANFFSPWHEGNPWVERLVMDQARFPPAFPMLIGLAGGGSDNMPVAHLVTCITFILSAVMFYFWAGRMLGSRLLGAACMAIYALLPKTLIYVVEIWSEFLFMALAFAAFLLMDYARRSREHEREALLACALFIGVSLLTRTIGAALVAAFVLFLFMHRIRSKYLYLLVIAALPLCWELIKIINGYSGDYSEDLERYMSRSGAMQLLLQDMPRNAYLLVESWGKHFAVEPNAAWPMQAAALILLGLALAGGAKRAVDRHPDPWYLLAYLGIVLVWPHPDHNTRFLYPLVPLALVYIFAGLSLFTGMWNTRVNVLSCTVLVLVMLGMIVPNAVFVANRFLTPMPGYISEDFRHTRHYLTGANIQRNYREAERREVVIRMLGRIDEHLAPHECLYAVHPVSAILYSDRRSILLPERITRDSLDTCEHLFVMNLVGKFPSGYPLNDMDRDRLTLIDMERDRSGEPQAFLFKITR